MLSEPVKGALRLAAVSREALALGLAPGMTLADARARIPDLPSHPHDPAADAALLARMAEACDRWSPLVALDPPDGLLLDVTGVAHLFAGRGPYGLVPKPARKESHPVPHPEVPKRSGGLEGGLQNTPRSLEVSFEAADAAPQDEGAGRITGFRKHGGFAGEAALRGEAVRRFRRAGFSTRATIAGTPDAARTLARMNRDGIVPPGAEEVTLRPLPVSGLGLDEATRKGLALAGLKRIGDLDDLPSQTLSARFGQALPRRVGRVLGREDVRITPLRPPPACRAERRLTEPLAHAASIEAVLAELIGQAAQTLEAAGEGGRAFEAAFFRADGGVRRISVETARPSRDPGTILRLIREKLDALADPLDPGYGYDLIRLDVPRTEPLGAHQLDLDGGTAAEDAVCALVDRLVARFGTDRVLRFSQTDTHDPIRAARLVPASFATSLRVAWEAPEADEPPLRPLQLFEPPQPIEALAEVPDGPPLRFRWRQVSHRIVRAEGPERIAPEWWRAPEASTRDYFRVEDEVGRRFWVFREGFYESEAERPRWYLHGFFA